MKQKKSLNFLGGCVPIRFVVKSENDRFHVQIIRFSEISGVS